MDQAEVLATIRAVFGSATHLRDLRPLLPTGRSSAYPAADTAEAQVALAPDAAIVPELTLTQREILIDQGLLMLEAIYAHLPLKRALHAIDPVQRLQLLRLRHEVLDERAFQSAMIDIFVGLRDLHTNYTLPTGYRDRFAFLPFRVEEYYVGKARKYLVSWVSAVNSDPSLREGAEITHWNGMPIELAVARNAEREAGSNMEARRARGLEALTLRWLGQSVPPDEDWIRLTFEADGEVVESQFDWDIVTREDLATLLQPASDQAMLVGIDIKAELLRHVRKGLFDVPSLRAEEEMAVHRMGAGLGAPPANVSVLPDVYPRFGAVTTPSGKFGYIRLATFAPPNDGTDINDAVAEFARILRVIPQNGLILDVRGNPGGYINFGERLLQMLTPRSITPEPFHFIATPFTRSIAESEATLTQWKDPIKTALATGAGFSQGFPLTDPAQCNNIGQIYQGPVVLVTDATCYSTTDIFAAGFQDHEVGTIIGCHDNTGAGGANVWDYTVLKHLDAAPNPFQSLPGDATFRVAARRSTRVGPRSGLPLEDLGVVPDERYYMTRNDLLQHNVDLIDRVAEILKGKPKYSLRLTPTGSAPVTELQIESHELDRVDLVVADRPVLSLDISTASVVARLPVPLDAGTAILARGYRAGQLVVSARTNQKPS